MGCSAVVYVQVRLRRVRADEQNVKFAGWVIDGRARSVKRHAEMNPVKTCLLESVLSADEGREANEARLAAHSACSLVCYWESFKCKLSHSF